jgi:branched-chain amino acid transport system substrate-binding protein
MNGFLSSVSRAARKVFSRRSLAVAGAAALVAGCQVIPKTETVSTGPVVDDRPAPTPTALPTDDTRHRVALLVPMSGQTSAVGQALANATTMALLDSNANNLRITTYDTGTGAREAARQAVVDGNKLIIGPLLSRNVAAVQAQARPAGVPTLSFSNDTTVASPDVFLMGYIPEQSVARSVEYARARGSNQFAALVPQGDYGERSLAALRDSLAIYGGQLIGQETYERGNTSIVSAAQRLRTKGGYDTVLIADGPRLAMQAAGELKRDGAQGTRLLGTELWSGEGSLTRSSAIDGSLFSAVSDRRFKRFADSYEARFGTKPYRIATLGYDTVLLTLGIARNWQVGDAFPKQRLFAPGGFVGLDGAFRFGPDGVAQRALEVRQVNGGEITEVDAAPARFEE